MGGFVRTPRTPPGYGHDSQRDICTWAAVLSVLLFSHILLCLAFCVSGGISPVFELGSGRATRAGFPKALHDLADLLRVAEACSVCQPVQGNEGRSEATTEQQQQAAQQADNVEKTLRADLAVSVSKLLQKVCQPVQGNEGRSEATTEQQQQAAQQADNVEKTLRADLAVSVSKLLQKVYQPGQGSEGRIQSTVTTEQQQQHAAQQIMQPGRQDQTDQVQTEQTALSGGASSGRRRGIGKSDKKCGKATGGQEAEFGLERHHIQGVVHNSAKPEVA
ncbi:Hypp2498 [Branchiostoma lanceolatum]|uniref:Hypp2498 protein n=1 Tax=Branchiostoma lanceolatum TaxID=7740 RepID=A0A8K0EMZ1_BRALA|nr:Hypp2498 [Branchiostoma lanceolatum]